MLTCVEQGAVLADRTWYRIEPAAGFGVQPFSLDLCTLRGDATGDGRVLANDYNVVKVHIGEGASSWSRADLNGDGVVLANDYNVVKVHIGNEAPAKAGGGGPGGGQAGDPNDQADNPLVPSATACCGQGAGAALVGVAGFLGLFTSIRRENGAVKGAFSILFGTRNVTPRQ